MEDTSYASMTTENLQSTRYECVAEQQLIEAQYQAAVKVLQDAFQPKVTSSQKILRGVIEELQKRDDAAIEACKERLSAESNK